MTSCHILRHMMSFDRPSFQEVDCFINDDLLRQKRRDQKFVRGGVGVEVGVARKHEAHDAAFVGHLFLTGF